MEIEKPEQKKKIFKRNKCRSASPDLDVVAKKRLLEKMKTLNLT